MVELPHQKAITLSEEDYDVSVSADLLENPVDAQLRQWGLTGHADIAISLAKKCFGAEALVHENCRGRVAPCLVCFRLPWLSDRTRA